MSIDRAKFQRRFRSGFKSTLIRQKLFRCQNHSSNSWNKLHDMIVGNHKEREVLYRNITFFNILKSLSLLEKFITTKKFISSLMLRSPLDCTLCILYKYVYAMIEKNNKFLNSE